MISKTTASEWTRAAMTPGTTLNHRRRGSFHSFTVTDEQSGQVLGIALCDGASGRESFLVETPTAPAEVNHS